MSRNFPATFFAAFLALAWFAGVPAPVRAVEPYEKLEHCHLLPNSSNDGDSFHVGSAGKEFIFRIYFVDAPEVENEFPARVKEQAKYFGITPREALHIGKIAAQFTHEKLAGKSFTVYTRWQKALGESRLQRYYAHIIIDDQTLSELLVANGLGRIFGTPATMPDHTSATVFKAHLATLEAKAKSQHLGAWSINAPARTTDNWGSFFPAKPSASPATLVH